MLFLGKIYKSLNCNADELELIVSELRIADEVNLYNYDGINGFCAKENGLSAFSNKKYKHKITKRRKEWVKFFVQTLIPILALIVAVISLSIKFNNLKLQSEKELQILRTTIHEQGIRLDKLEKNQIIIQPPKRLF